MKIAENISLRRLNSFGVEARAARLVEWETARELVEVDFSGPWMTLGGGNNVLFTRDYAGTLIKSAARRIEITRQTEEQVFVRAEAGVDWDDLVAWCVERELWGVENLSAIPGTVGAAPIQNIGAYGAEAKDVIVSVECFAVESGTVLTIAREHCEFGYRDSVFKRSLRGKAIVTAVNFGLSRVPKPNLGYGALAAAVAKSQESRVRSHESRVKSHESANAGGKLGDETIRRLDNEAIRQLDDELTRHRSCAAPKLRGVNVGSIASRQSDAGGGLRTSNEVRANATQISAPPTAPSGGADGFYEAGKPAASAAPQLITHNSLLITHDSLLMTEHLSPQIIRQAVIEIRAGKLPDPRETGNAGSFFKNPVVETAVAQKLAREYPEMPQYPAGDDTGTGVAGCNSKTKLAAGWLIEQAGWRGKSIGPVGIDPRQALVVVNTGGATGAQIVDFAQQVREDVRAKFGVELEMEVNII